MTTQSSDLVQGGSTALRHIASSWLDAEADATSSASTRALLLHESALIHEGAGNVTEAARLHLQAVNTDPQLSEPVERLLMIFEQRHSLKNLGRVIERLYQLAATVEDRERASWERAAFALIEQRDTGAAREVLLDIVEAVPNGVVAWLLLNILAEQSQDYELLERVLRTRSSLTANSNWDGLLSIELAGIQHELGKFDSALETLDRVIASSGPMTFSALDLLEHLSFSQNQHDVLSRVLVSKASILERATHDAALGDSLGVPRWRRSETHVADAFIRAAIARHADGNAAEAATLIERALGLVPADPIAQHIAMLCAEERQDLALAVSFAKSIATRSEGVAAGAAWLRAAFYELERNNGAAAFTAIRAAIGAAPHSVALRASELHIAAAHDSTSYVTAIESCTEALHGDFTKGRNFLAAAELWTRRHRDSKSARAALAQAALLGIEPQLTHRVARLLAASLNDEPWYDEATGLLATSASNPDERAELWIELCRLRVCRNQPERANSAMKALAAHEPSGGIAVTFEAYNFAANVEPKNSASHVSAPSLAPETGLPTSQIDSPLLRLSEQSSNPALKRAFAVANVLRTQRSGNRSAAGTQLTALIDKDPADALLVLTLSDLLLAQPGAEREVSGILSSGAALISDATLAGIAAVKAALLAARVGDLDQCRVALDCARLRAPTASAIVEPWILRKVFPNENSVRREVLEGLLDSKWSERRVLEQFALELATGNLATAGLILEGLEPSDTSIGIAIAFAKILLDSEANTAAIDALVAQVPAIEAAAAALKARYAYATFQAHSPEHLEAVRQWVYVDPSVIPALEYLAAARVMGHVDSELEGWNELSQRLDGTQRLAMNIAQSRVRLFDSSASPPLLASRETQARIINCEASRPGSDPRRRSFALNEFAPLLEETDRRLVRILAGFNELASGNAEQALASFKSIIEEDAGNIAAWEGIRFAAQSCQQPLSAAEAMEALAGLYHDSSLAAELFEAAATVWFEVGNESRAEAALKHAVTRDIHRFTAFDRLFRRVRERNEGASLLELIDLRLDVSEDVDELVKLHWERARVLRSLGDRDSALQALENVTLLEPDHVGALALAAEISIASRHLAEAAKFLERLARLETAPSKQRTMSGLAAADLYDGKLNLPELAVSVLLALDGAGLGSLAQRERLAKAAARSKNWDLAAETLLDLADTRESSTGRVEAARLAMGIYRDRLSTPAQSLPAVRRLLTEIPDDPEAIDYVLEQHFSPLVNRELCEQLRDALRAKLLDEPIDEASIGRLAQIAALLDDIALRQITLGALVCVGAKSSEVIEELDRIALRVARLPRMTLDEACFADLAEAGDDGPLAALFATLAPYLAEALGPSLAVFGVTKKQRVDPRAGLPLRNEIASWAGALGVRDFELYIGGIESDDVIGIPGETPSLIVGASLRAPLAPAHRQRVARELYAIRRGTSILRHRTPTEVAALVVATCRIAEVPIAAPPYALVDEFIRLLGALPRKAKKLLPSLCSRLAAEASDPMDWHAAAVSSMDRMAALAGGDASIVIAADESQTHSGFVGSQPIRTERLLRFMFSNQYLSLRERLGIGVK